MEYTEQYVYVNVGDAVAATEMTDDQLRLTLNFNNDRVPYALVEVISFILKTNNSNNNRFTLKCTELPQNYLGYDNMGCALSVAGFSADITAGHHVYELCGSSPKLMFANPRLLTLYITNDQGVKQPVGVPDNIEGFTVIIKVSYPKTGEIPGLYRSQIPL